MELSLEARPETLQLFVYIPISNQIDTEVEFGETVRSRPSIDLYHDMCRVRA